MKPFGIIFKIQLYLTILLVILCQNNLISQVCNITVNSPSPTTVCPGTVVNLTASATVYAQNQSFNFNTGSTPTGWSVAGGANFSSPCGAGSGNYYWASTAGSGVPQIQTAGFDICTGGTIVFDMKYAVQGGNSPCEGPDLANEGVSLQYSLNGGSTWINIIYYSPGGYTLPSNPGTTGSVATGTTAYTSWNTFTVPIPPAAISTNTMFRWVQTSSSGSCCDNWGLDNVFINASSCLNTNINWNTGNNGTNAIAPTITQDSCIIAQVYDNSGNFLCASTPYCFSVFSPSIDGGSDRTICEGTSTTLSASGGTGFTWTNGVIDGVPFSPPLGTTTYTVTGTDVNGCTASDQVEITVVPGASVNVDAGPDQTICIGESVTLTATGATTYVWDNGGSNGQIVTPATTTTYIVTGTLGLCQDDDAITITVSSGATPTFNPIADVCVGAPAPVLPTTSTNGVVGTWSSAVSTATAGTFNYTFTPNATACQSTAQISVTINPNPSVNAGVDQTLCVGESITLSGSGSSGYLWDNGITDGVAFTPSLGVTTYTVTVTEPTGCTNSDDVVITVSPLPVVNAGLDQAICIGESVTLTASGATNYVWSNGGGNGQSVSPLTTTTYTVIGSIGSCTDDDEITITVNPLPQVIFTPDVITGCSPLDVVFTLQSPPGIACSWSFGDGNTSTGCGTTSNTYLGVGCNDVTMTTTDANGCIGSQTYNNLICLVEYPVAEFTPNPSELSLLNTSSTMINHSQGAATYSWNFGDGNSGSSLFEPTHVFPYDAPGSYLITLIVENFAGCQDTAYQTIRVNDEVIYYVPNTFTPDGDSYNQTFKPIFYSGFDPYDYTLSIYNRWGELIFESHNTEVGWDGTYARSSKVQDGTYIWKIEFKQSMNDKRRTAQGHVTIIR